MKKGQMRISFSMIFSIILIVVFIAVAFIAVKAVLPLGCKTESGTFIQDLQNEVNRIWRGSGENKVLEFKINNCNFEEVCFYDTLKEGTSNQEKIADFRIFTGDEGDHNLYFYPRKKAEIKSVLIEHIDLENLEENPTCFVKENNVIKIRLSKNLNEALVSVS